MGGPLVPMVGDVGRLLVASHSGGGSEAATTARSSTTAQQRSGSTVPLHSSQDDPSSSASLNPFLPNATAIATLDTGIAIALAQSSFEELAAHGVWSVTGTNSCHLPLPTIEAIFKAKVADAAAMRHGAGGGGRATAEAAASIADSASASERLMRFVESVARSCVGIYFDMAGMGLGRTALSLAVDALIADHGREAEVEAAIQKAEEEERRRRAAQQQMVVVSGAGMGSRGKTVGQPPTAATSTVAAAGHVAPSNANAVAAAAAAAASAARESTFDAHYTYPCYAVVDLSRNPAGDDAGDTIARLLEHNASVVALGLRAMGLPNNSSTCAMLYTIAFRNTTLTHLDLSGIAGSPRNSLGGAAGIALGDILHHNAVLAVLRVRECGLDAKALAHLFTNAMTHAALAELDVGGNRVDKSATCAALAAMLAFGSCRLERLGLEGCGIGDAALRSLARGFSQDLHSLDADEAAQSEAVALQKLHPLYDSYHRQQQQQHGSSLSDDGGGEEGSDSGGGSRMNTPLPAGAMRQLQRRGRTPATPSTGRGAAANQRGGNSGNASFSSYGHSSSLPPYIPVVPASASLKHLNLSNNTIGADGLSALSNRIARLPKLETLSLSGNALMARGGDAEGMRLGRALSGVDALLEVLGETVPTLRELDLSSCGLAAMPTRIDFFLCRSAGLRRLRIGRNPFGDFGARMLGEAFFQRAYAVRARMAAMGAGAATTSGGLVLSSSSGAGGNGVGSIPSSARPTSSSPRGVSGGGSSALHRDDVHGEPFELIDVTDCGITAAGMASFLQHLATAPRVQITAGGLVMGARAATVVPHDGAGVAMGLGCSGGEAPQSQPAANNGDDGAGPAAGEQNPSPSPSAAAAGQGGGYAGLVSTAATPIAAFVLPATASLTHLPKSLFAPEVAVPSGYHGFAVNSLRLLQPAWTRWGDPSLVAALCHTPALEHVDISARYGSDQLAAGLAAHKRSRIAASVPRYQQQMDLVRREEGRLFEARDLIADEAKLTERTKEAYKSMRDRQKAILAAMKTESAATTELIAQQNEELEAASALVRQAEQHQRETTEANAAELTRLQRRIETVVNMRRDMEAQAKTVGGRQRRHSDLLRTAEAQLEGGQLRVPAFVSSYSPAGNSLSPEGGEAPQEQRVGPSRRASAIGGDASLPAITKDGKRLSKSAIGSGAAASPSQTDQPSAEEGGDGPSSTEAAVEPPFADPLADPDLIAAAQSVGLAPIDLHIVALSRELRVAEEERDHERGTAEFYKKRLEDLERRAALVEATAGLGGGGGGAKGGKGKKGGGVKKASAAEEGDNKKKDGKKKKGGESKKRKAVVAKP